MSMSPHFTFHDSQEIYLEIFVPVGLTVSAAQSVLCRYRLDFRKEKYLKTKQHNVEKPQSFRAE